MTAHSLRLLLITFVLALGNAAFVHPAAAAVDINAYTSQIEIKMNRIFSFRWNAGLRLAATEEFRLFRMRQTGKPEVVIASHAASVRNRLRRLADTITREVDTVETQAIRQLQKFEGSEQLVFAVIDAAVAVRRSIQNAMRAAIERIDAQANPAG